jgi:acyl-CoA synthetase (NDP forming)
MQSSLLPFFRPKGIVVIGASTSPEKLDHGVALKIAAHVGVKRLSAKRGF